MFEDNENTSPSNVLLGANQLPEDEAMINADEAFAEALEEELLSEMDETGIVQRKLIAEIQERFEEAKRHREADEQRWLLCYQNYRGVYGKTEKFSEHEKSRVFVKATKTKVVAAYGQIIDVLFGSGKFPITVRATPVPEGVESVVHLSQTPENVSPDMSQESMYDVGYVGDDREIKPGAKLHDVAKGLRKEIAQGDTSKLKAGPGFNGEPQLSPAKQAAARMEKLIHDQIIESNGAEELRSAIFEAALFGTGIIKGPFTTEKISHSWVKDPETGQRNYTPYKTLVPKIEFCSIWDAFPDVNARSMKEAEWFIQRHRMSRSQIRALQHRPLFNKDVINQILDLAPNYMQEDYESQMDWENRGINSTTKRYEVLEYWGLMDKELLEGCGLMVGEEFSHLEEVQVNAWLCHGKLMRLVLNPFTPKRIPYLSFDYERNPYSFFGVGVAENMSDSQQIMNGHARMAIDNLALAGNVVLDVDESALEPGQTYNIHAGKVFKRNGGSPGQAVYAIKIPNTAPENLQMFDKFRQLADESTGIPSYAHGQTGVMSTTRTAAGMSMLMGAASLNVKTVISNIDDFLLTPLGEAMFQWNMNFYEGELEIEGDLEIKSGGAASLMQNEVLSQRLQQLMQLMQNPALAPFIKIPTLIRQFAESLEIDPDELLNDADQAAVYAAIIGQAGGLNPLSGGTPLPSPPNAMGSVGGVPAPAQPGMEEFTGNPPVME